MVIHLNIDSNCLSGISAHQEFLGKPVFTWKPYNWSGKVVNFLESGVVANAKENKIIDDEIFVRRNALRKKEMYIVYM